MARRTITIEGLEQLLAQLEEIPGEVTEGARRAVRDSAGAVRDETRDTVRVDTGRMRQGTEARVSETRLRADVGWFDPDLYYAKFQEFGTSEISANPALTRAAEAERGRLAGRVEAEVRRELER